MPKKKSSETPEEQSARFRREAEKLVKAGEIDPAKGDAALDLFVRSKPPPA